MAIPSMQESHLLEGNSNFLLWKYTLQNLVEVENLWYLMEKNIKPPTNPKYLAKCNTNVVNLK
jgi:hypothetical protein